MPVSVSLVVLTGAGISADSGLSTFRGGGGLWEGRRVEDVATPEAWRRAPASVWRFYQLRRAGLLEVRPNAAHHALARLERAMGEAGHRFLLVTQNVDGLHERAGSRPIRMHGSLEELLCERCGHVTRDLEHVDPEAFVPCPACGHERLRPNVVWFGEIPHETDRILRAVAGATHFFACGTSGVVYPAAGLLETARAAGAETFVNSLDPPENLSPRDRFLPGRAIEVVPPLVEAWIARWCAG